MRSLAVSNLQPSSLPGAVSYERRAYELRESWRPAPRRHCESKVEIVILNDHAMLNGGPPPLPCVARGLASRSIRVTLVTCIGPVAPRTLSMPNLEVVCLGQQEIAKDSNRVRRSSLACGIRRRSKAVRKVLSDKPRGAPSCMFILDEGAVALRARCRGRDGVSACLTLHDFFITCPNGGFFVHGPDELAPESHCP